MAKLKNELNALIGKNNTKQIFLCKLENKVNISEFTPENIEYAHDFFQNINFVDVEKYTGDDFTFFDVVKKFYDVELPLDIVMEDAKTKLILSRKFSFDAKKKIVHLLNSCEEPKSWERIFKLLDLIDSEDEFLFAQYSMKDIVASDKLYEKVMADKSNLTDAVNIVKYNMHNFKKDLSFENMAWFVNILLGLPMEAQNIVRIWINNINSDDECKMLEPVFISIIECKKLTDDVAYKKISIAQAVKIYDEVKSKVHNNNLSSKNLNNAFSIIMTLQDDNNFDENRLAVAIDLISLIHDDREFEEIKIFISILSAISELPNVIRKNNFSLTQVLPLMLKIYFMDAQSILKKNFSFECMRELVKILEKCNKNEKEIKTVLELIEKINADNEFNYCKEFLLELAKNKKMLREIRNNKIDLFDQIEKLYINYFRISPVSSYTLKIIVTRKFSFNMIVKIDRLIHNKQPLLRDILVDLIKKLSTDNEVIFAYKFFVDFENLDDYDAEENLLAAVKKYYKTVLDIPDEDENKNKVLDNTNLSFENIADAINILSDEEDIEKSQKIAKLISMLKNEDEYIILQPFFYKLIEDEEIISSKGNIFYVFNNALYEKAGELKVRKILNNKFLSLLYKFKGLEYLEQVEDIDARDRIAELICTIKSDEEYEKISPFFDRLLPIEDLKNAINFNSIDIEQLIQLCKLNVDKVWACKLISLDRLKKLVIYLLKCDNEKLYGIIEFMCMLDTDEQFDVIFPYLNDLFDDNKIILAIYNGEITIDAVFNLCKVGASKIFRNHFISFTTKMKISKSLIKVKNASRRENIINIISELTVDHDVVFLSEFLTSGNIEKSDKSYFDQACKFYSGKLIDIYGQENGDISDKITCLVNSRKFSYPALEGMAKILYICNDNKKRDEIFSKMMMFKNDTDFANNVSSLKDDEQEGTSLDSRIKKASESAESINKQIEEEYNNSAGFQSNSPIIFSDGNLITNFVDRNVIMQIKDKKLVIMTNEAVKSLTEEYRGKIISLSIKINEELDENVDLFNSYDEYFEEFKDYLNENSDKASIEEDKDEGITYCCLISNYNLETVFDYHEKFVDKINSEDSEDNEDNEDIDEDVQDE